MTIPETTELIIQKEEGFYYQITQKSGKTIERAVPAEGTRASNKDGANDDLEEKAGGHVDSRAELWEFRNEARKKFELPEVKDQ